MNTTQRNARGEATRQKILAETLRLVSRYGYDSTTISRIVKETGRPASSIYWLFENKDELITTALESSYSTAPAVDPQWSGFTPGQPVVRQLFAELAPELRASETEDPIRVGIMLALEGAASDSQVQMPFRSRRLHVQRRVEKWWHQALEDSSPSGELQVAPTAQADHLAKLTMAFLDGHYISDVTASEKEITHRARLLAHVLKAAFEHASSDCAHEGAIAAPRPEEDPPEEPTSSEQTLLRTTRQLVAEHGYEGATMSRICQRSGMKRSSVYWRYKDKDALVKAAVSDPFIDLLRPLGQPSTEGDDWLDTLCSALVDFTHRANHNPETVKSGLLLKLQRWDSPDSAGAAVAAGAEELENDLAGWFNQVMPPEETDDHVGEHLAWLITRLADGIMLDLVLWHQGIVFSPRGCAGSILSSALTCWRQEIRQ